MMVKHDILKKLINKLYINYNEKRRERKKKTLETHQRSSY
jgi:hypothetical protein